MGSSSMYSRWQPAGQQASTRGLVPAPAIAVPSMDRLVAAVLAADSTAPSMDRLAADSAAPSKNRLVAAVVAADSAAPVVPESVELGIPKRFGAFFPGNGPKGQGNGRDANTKSLLSRSTPGMVGESRCRRWAPGIDANME